MSSPSYHPSTADRVAFAVGTGRCGTRFLARAMAHLPGVAASHERHILGDSFHRYCRWNALPVDERGFLNAKERAVASDLQKSRLSFESSAYLSLAVDVLYRELGAKIVLMVRHPAPTVNSIAEKGWYAAPYAVDDPDLAAGYQQQDHFHRFFARVAPQGAFFETWNGLTPVGKAAWYWNELNTRTLTLLEDVPEDHFRVAKLEEMTYARFCDLAAFLGAEEVMSEAAFAALTERRPNALSKSRHVHDWTETERAEYERAVAPAASRLGYAYAVEDALRMLGERPDDASDAARPSLADRAAGWLVHLKRKATASSRPPLTTSDYTEVPPL